MIFPLHDREELNLLCKSKRNGARDPIIIHVKLMPSDAPGTGKDEKFRMTNLEWGVDFFSLTNLVKTS